MTNETLFGVDLFGQPITPVNAGPLAQRFIMPPFSVLDARQGEWQARKNAWLSLGIKSEIGRGDDMLGNGGGIAQLACHAAAAETQSTLGAIAQNQAGANGILTSPGKYAARKASPGGAPRPACNYSRNERGDGLAAPIAAREMIDNGNGRLTWVPGNRPVDNMDDASRKILAAGRKSSYAKAFTTDVPLADDSIVPSASGTSIFDPVLCELMYTWFCPGGAWWWTRSLAAAFAGL